MRNILLLYFDPGYTTDVENELPKYQIAAAGVSLYVEYICKPTVDMTPGEYLYSENVSHEKDTVWSMYSDNDDKRNWRIFPRFQYQNSTGWHWSPLYPDVWEGNWEPLNHTVVNELNRPFPYYWAFHGHSSLWHHTREYDNTYRAWDYTLGEGTISMIFDPQGFWTQHPDLIDRWHLLAELEHFLR
ncbi:MAG: hypothetical protein Q8J62_00865 [Candidatus Cloacimonadaceae bacterium]|nr:hypothetical protein [Candidatus Cloacimonadaceae bacterium]